MSYWRRVFKPSDIDALRQVADGKAPPSACPTCKEVPDEYSVVEKATDRDPDPFRAHLEGAGSLKRCPASGALYWQNVKYEYLAGGSEDEYTFERVTPERAGNILVEWANEATPRGTPSS